MTDWTRLARSFWTGLPPDVDGGPSALAAFDAWFQPRLARDLQVFFVLITVFNLGFWATDAAVFTGVPGAAAALADGRAFAVALVAAAFLAVRAAPSHASSIGAVTGLTACLAAAVTFGRIGGPSTAWFHFIYPFALTPVGWYMRPGRRAVVTVLYGLAVVGGYFGARPAYLDDPMAMSTLGHFGYIVVLGVVIGVYVDRSRIRSWAFQRAVEEERARLAERVAEQTDDLRRLARRLDAAQEHERTHLARELHDELGQTLGALRMALKVATSRFERDPAGLRPHFAQLAALLDDLTEQTRRILRDLRPIVLDDLGLPAAVEWLADQLPRRGGPPCTVDVPVGRADLPPAVANAAYRCVQEALTNVARHASARTVRVRVELEGGELRAEVEDDGVGLAEGRTQGLGLLGIRERVAAVGGRLAIDSTRGTGTRVRVTIPVAVPA